MKIMFAQFLRKLEKPDAAFPCPSHKWRKTDCGGMERAAKPAEIHRMRAEACGLSSNKFIKSLNDLRKFKLLKN